MEMKRIALTSLLIAFVAVLPVYAQRASGKRAAGKRASAQRSADDAVSRPLKAMIQAIRASRDEQALGHLANQPQGQFLLGSYWNNATTGQRAEFTQLFHKLLKQIAFPRVRDNLKNLDSITYAPGEVAGNEATVDSSIFIKHPLRTQEIKVRYSLVKEGAAWKVVDASVLGASSMEEIRDSQIRPVLNEGGMERLLQTMRNLSEQ